MSVSKDPIRIGPLALPTREGLIHECARHLEREASQVLISRPGDSLVAFKNLEVEFAQKVRTRLSADTKIGGLLSAWNFDPPGDHVENFDFGWFDALINDFRGINDDLDTLEGVGGDHFATLLEWQPKVDPTRTALFALIGDDLPGFASQGSAAAEPLVAALSSHGYDGVILSAYGDEAEEFENLTRFAKTMRKFTPLPIAVASTAEFTDWRLIFDMQLLLTER